MVEDPNEDVAQELAELYEWYKDFDGYSLHPEGFKKMQECFELVAPEQRANVFHKFLDELDWLGIQYDKEEFRGVEV